MNEKTLCSNLVSEIRAGLLGSVVLKHNDRVTKGIPDISVTWGGHTTWLEAKYLRAAVTWDRFDKGLQFEMCKRMGVACLYVLFQECPRRILLMPAIEVPGFLASKGRVYRGWASDTWDYGFVITHIRGRHRGFEGVLS